MPDEPDDLDPQPKPKRGRKVSVEKMAELRRKGLSLQQIGAVAGITKQSAGEALRRSGLDLEADAAFKADKAVILRQKQKLLLSAITEEKVEKMSVRDASVSYGILQDKENVLEGRSPEGHTFVKIDLSVYQTPPPTPVFPDPNRTEVDPDAAD